MVLNEAGSTAKWVDMLYSFPEAMERAPTWTWRSQRDTTALQSTLSRSQSQVLQFLNGASEFSDVSPCGSATAPGSSIWCHPRADGVERRPSSTAALCSSEVIDCGLSQPPVVMHPNLVCTLKSILQCPRAPEVEVGSPDQSRCASGDSSHSGVSQVSEMPGSEQGGAGSPESAVTSWPRNPTSTHLAQEAITVPVDLIQNRRPYHCASPSCSRTFKNPQTMRMHLKTHTIAMATTLATLTKSHQSGHLGPDPELGTLKAGHNKKIPSRCPTCYRTFVGLYELRRHFGRKHSEGEKRHGCRKCGKRFHVEVDVRDHEKLCGEPIVCACGMKFAFKCNLVAHKRSHPQCHS